MVITVAMALSFHQVEPPHPHCGGERTTGSPQAALPMLHLSSCAAKVAGGQSWPLPVPRAVGVPPLPSVQRCLQPVQKRAKTLSCYQASLPDINEHQFNQRSVRYTIHFISNFIFSLAGKCLLVKNFANASRSNLSEQILRCWMKPCSQWSTKWSCLRTSGEGRGL